MDREKIPFEIPKPCLSAMLEAIADFVVEVGTTKVGKVLLQNSIIEYCYVCDRKATFPIRYRKVSKRIHHIYLTQRFRLRGFKIKYEDVFGNKYDGLYCEECEKKHNINDFIAQKCRENNVKLNFKRTSNIWVAKN